MRGLLNGANRALVLICLVGAFPAAAHAGWTQGQFTSNGTNVIEYHCVPSGSGPHPAIILLHGAGKQGQGDDAYETICGQLADAGYYTEFIEYYSQTKDRMGGPQGSLRKIFPIWLEEIHAGLDAMGHNPQIDSHRVGMLGFSLGAFLALATGEKAPDKIAVIVEYYGGLHTNLQPMAAKLPPTLILHGGADHIVPVGMALKLDKLLTEANRPHEMKIYPGATHAFNFKIPAAYNEADAQDAWDRTLNFFARYLGGKPASKSEAAK